MEYAGWNFLPAARSLGSDEAHRSSRRPRKLWLAVLLLAGLSSAAALVSFPRPSYEARVKLRLGQPSTGLIGLRSRLQPAGSRPPPPSEMQLIASRDLARRAIKDLDAEDRREFDPEKQNPNSQALVWLGARADPARRSKADRVLEAFQSHLNVDSRERNLLAITFQSEDREFAAKAANHIADLYREDALPRGITAYIVSPAVPPDRRLYAGQTLIALTLGMTSALIAFGAISCAARHRPRDPREIEPPKPPHLVKGEPCFPPHAQPTAGAGTTRRILDLASRRPDSSGLKILATAIGQGASTSALIDVLARDLNYAGHTLILNFDRADNTGSCGEPADCVRPPSVLDLAEGSASFAEFIRYDSKSRAHFLRVGYFEERQHQALLLVLDVLAETYNFLLINGPPLQESSIACTLAANADLALLVAPAAISGTAIVAAESQLARAGAREVLLVTAPHAQPQSFFRDAA